jgi:hypothetical protein
MLLPDLTAPQSHANAGHTSRVPRVELESSLSCSRAIVKSASNRLECEYWLLFAGVAWSKSPVSHGGAFRPRDTPMSDEQEASAGHYREIAEKIRQLARQTTIPEAREELFDLADRLDRMAELAKKDPG